MGGPLATESYSDAFGLTIDDGLGGNVCTPGFDGLICSPIGSIGPLGGVKRDRKSVQGTKSIARPLGPLLIS